MESLAGVLRSEALLTTRAAHFVCFPGTATADRIITVRGTEYAIGLVLLRLCRSMRTVDRGTLLAACAIARASLRAGASEEDVLAQARARGLLHNQDAEAAEAPAMRPGAEGDAFDASARLVEPCAPADSPLPPLAAPETPPSGPQLRRIVNTRTRWLQAWTPPSEESTAKRICGNSIAALVPVKEELLLETCARTEVPNGVSLLAQDVRRTGRCIGIPVFLMYAHSRRVRVHAVFGSRSVDLLDAFAPALAGGCREVIPPLTTVFCRCITFWEGSTPHRALRALTADADLLHGNHWVIAVPMAAGAPLDAARPHYPCQGARCGKPGGSCMSPLMETLKPLGYQALPTAEQGDCGVDVLAFWDGQQKRMQRGRACGSSWPPLSKHVRRTPRGTAF